MSVRQKPFRRGEKPRARRLNGAIDSRLVRVTGDGIAQAHLIGDEGTIGVDQIQINQRVPKHICQFIVKSVEATYYVCRTWDGTNEGSIDINVAK